MEPCPNCGSKKIIKDNFRGELYCSKCGTVIQEKTIDTGEGRINGPLRSFPYTKPLGSFIDWSNRGIPEEQIAKFARLRWHQKKSFAFIDHYYEIAPTLELLRKAATKIGMDTNAQKQAIFLYKKAKKKLAQKFTSKKVIVAVLFIICRQRKMLITLRKVANIVGIKDKGLMRTYQAVKKELNIETPPPISKPIDYIPEFASNLGLSEEIKKKTIELLEEVEKSRITMENTNRGIAAGVIYYASRLLERKIKRKEIAKKTGTSGTTIGKVYKKLQQCLKNRERFNALFFFC